MSLRENPFSTSKSAGNKTPGSTSQNPFRRYTPPSSKKNNNGPAVSNVNPFLPRGKDCSPSTNNPFSKAANLQGRKQHPQAENVDRPSRRGRRRRKNALRKFTFDEDGDLVMTDADAHAEAGQADSGHLGTKYGSRHSSLPEKADEDVEMADADSFYIQDVDVEMTDV